MYAKGKKEFRGHNRIIITTPIINYHHHHYHRWSVLFLVVNYYTFIHEFLYVTHIISIDVACQSAAILLAVFVYNCAMMIIATVHNINSKHYHYYNTYCYLITTAVGSIQFFQSLLPTGKQNSLQNCVYVVSEGHYIMPAREYYGLLFVCGSCGSLKKKKIIINPFPSFLFFALYMHCSQIRSIVISFHMFYVFNEQHHHPDQDTTIMIFIFFSSRSQ